MRCLTLADALAERGVLCGFVTRKPPGNIVARIVEHGHRIELLATPQEAKSELAQSARPYSQWLGVPMAHEVEQSTEAINRLSPDMVIVDHYALDHIWHQRVCAGRTVMAIDDLADRQHDCNLLLDQNFGRRPTDYDSLVPPGAKLLVGPEYALLRPEFRANRQASLERRQTVRHRTHILISMGGADQENSTGRILDTLSRSSHAKRIDVTVVLGSAAPHLESVHKQAEQMPFPATVLSDVGDMASLLVDIDMAIGAAGGSVWERCCLGVPSLLLVIADNQRPATIALNEAKVAASIGDFHSSEWEDCLLFALKKWSDSEQLKEFSQRAASIVDGEGVLRVVENVMHHVNLNGTEA
ncbi:UDP-2,4-diacetamido-2,4,6-trideoxy-beta-L-altropyranose hydrolase [Altererythrobacter insulae]|nr:UDP-2,4-diacetamido-2,4,6-trideoxy-beta-L-altropyranose hydrolase [Altererythrobacter insulae]